MVAAGAVVVFIAGGAGLMYFYLTLFKVWQPASGVPAWRMLLLPGHHYAVKHMFDVLRPWWIWGTLRATGWPVRLVAGVLASLLVLALVAYALLMHRLVPW